MTGPLTQVYEDLKEVPLAVVGGGSHGKSTAIKHLLAWAIQDDVRVKVFDISLAQKYNTPVKNFVSVNITNFHEVENRDNCVYDLSMLGYDERRIFVARIIYEDWLNQRDGLLIDRDFIEKNPRILYVFDEGSSFLDSRSINKADEWGTTLRDFIASGRNYGQDGIIISRAISGEIATKYRRKCNYLLGRVKGDEEISYIRRGTDRDFIDVAKSLEKYNFIYYGTDRIDTPFTFPYNSNYGDPEDITPYPAQHNKKKGLWGHLYGKG